MKTNRRIVLVGPTASGKTFIKNCFKMRGFNVDVSYTTRRIRTGEAPDIDYHFISEEDFLAGVEGNQFFEHVEYGGCHYGTDNYGWANNEVFIMETDGLKHINSEDRRHTLIIYVNTPIELRKQRMESRNWTPEKIEERIKQDEIRFKDFITFDMEISSETTFF